MADPVTMAVISIGTGIMKAGAQMSAARSQQQMYDAQASQATLQGRSQAIGYRQQGAMVLRNLNETLAAVIARAGAGGIDPMSGSAAILQNYARAEASAEFGTAQDNAALAMEGATAQANIYRQAGQTALSTGRAQAFGTIMGSVGTAYNSGAFDSLNISPQAIT
jgi:hypothetical protein